MYPSKFLSRYRSVSSLQTLLLVLLSEHIVSSWFMYHWNHALLISNNIFFFQHLHLRIKQFFNICLINIHKKQQSIDVYVLVYLPGRTSILKGWQGFVEIRDTSFVHLGGRLIWKNYQLSMAIKPKLWKKWSKTINSAFFQQSMIQWWTNLTLREGPLLSKALFTKFSCRIQ